MAASYHRNDANQQYLKNINQLRLYRMAAHRKWQLCAQLISWPAAGSLAAAQRLAAINGAAMAMQCEMYQCGGSQKLAQLMAMAKAAGGYRNGVMAVSGA